uniref:Endonuclease domain-containing 1 protein-like n=1 Tax=Pelusios castaneus TaxID=367368 RepID=A0A8C8S0Y7_9SAUR
MDWRVLLGCISLWAGLVLAEVGSFDECKQYFCKEFQPFGFQISHWAQICQRYNRQYHFATLYDKANRIPYWSAYILSVANCPDQTSRKRQWFVEPQLANLDTFLEMKTENESTLSEKELRFSQAINEDYEDTSYTRGHLNPYSFQCDDSSTATFTLTNAVPMEPYFNQVRWHKLEKNLKRQLIENCISKRGTAYLVTGAVPSDNEKIPKTDEDKAGDRTRKYHQVSVPSHIWTAVSCDHPDNNRKFSFAFLAENKAASRLQLMSVEQLNSELSRLYSRTIKIFSNDCNSKSQKGQEILSGIKVALYNTFEILLTDQYSQLLPSEMKSRLDMETQKVIRSKNFDHNKMQVTNIRYLMSFPSLADWSSHFEKMYNEDNLACVLAPADDADPGEVAKASGSLARVCTVQEQKHLPGSSVTAQGWSCVEHVCGYRETTTYNWCYTSYDKDWDYCCTDKCTVNPSSQRYECSRGDGKSTKCSPQYSTVTVSGKACRADHPCGLYKKKYFWCYTDDDENWEYCCSPRHYCGKHSYDYWWCYTEDPQKSWQRCTP